MKKYKYIFFDFDGTLGDTSQGIIRTVQGTLQRMNLPEADPQAVARTIGLPLSECFRTATATPEERVNEAVEIYRAIFNDLALDCITLFPGVLETLHELSLRHVTMAVASSRHHFSLDPLVKQLGVSTYIPLSRVYGEDEALRPKPAPDMALKILTDLHADASQSLVVGDTTYDILMGNAALCDTCAVTYGNQDYHLLRTASPTYIISDIRDLL